MAVDYALRDQSVPPAYSIRMESCAVLAALDQLDNGEAVNRVGHSLGALIALTSRSIIPNECAR
jgi:hypothetical protein